jgi:hypothetical protein
MPALREDDRRDRVAGVSSTGRGQRLGGEDDFYVTPSWCVRRLLEKWNPPGGVWLEPGAGNGAIVRAVQSVRSDVHFIAWEIREEERRGLVDLGCTTIIGDFLEPSDRSYGVPVVIGNPPYSLAQEFIDRARIVAPKALICYLLRVNYVGSKDRNPFMSAHPPDIKQLSNRPSFTDGHTDSIEYAWMIWPPGTRELGSFQVLNLTPIAERKLDRRQGGPVAQGTLL